VGVTATTLYGYDWLHDVVVTQGGPNGIPSANTGQLFTVGPSGVVTCGTTPGKMVGFDIASSGQAFASLNVGFCTLTGLYSINLSTGAATSIGTIGGGKLVRDIAVVPRYQSFLPLVRR